MVLRGRSKVFWTRDQESFLGGDAPGGNTFQAKEGKSFPCLRKRKRAFWLEYNEHRDDGPGR